MSTAKKLSPEESLYPPASAATIARERLDTELHNRLIEIARLPSGWDDGNAIPTEAVLKRAARLGQLIIGFTNPFPPSVNIACSPDGDLVFTVFGDKREADLWVSDDSGSFHYIAKESGKLLEGDCPIAGYLSVGEWISGRGTSL